MVYEIVNMSDPYTIEAATLDVAFVACVFLGRGQYAFEPQEEGATAIPMFFGGTEDWCQTNLHQSLEQVVDRVTREKAAELAACFESCIYGKPGRRALFLLAWSLIEDAAKQAIWREAWQDQRSSMNDIGGRAQEMAKRLRAGSANPLVEAPQQVFVR